MEAKMRIAEDMSYRDLDLINPKDKDEMSREWSTDYLRIPDSLEGYSLTCAITGKEYTFSDYAELKRFKYNRYIRKYVQCVHSIDENVGAYWTGLMTRACRGYHCYLHF